MSTEQNQAGQDQKDNLTASLTDKSAVGVVVVKEGEQAEGNAAAAEGAADTGNKADGQGEVVQKPAENTQTTKAGQAAQNKQAQQAKLAQEQETARAKETVVVKTTERLAGGVKVTDSTAEVPTTFRDSAAWKKAVEVGNAGSKSSLGLISAYIDNMKPGKGQTPVSLARNQATFHNALQTILVTEKQNFSAVWTGVIEAVRQNLDTVFGLQYCQRGIDSAPDNILDENAIRSLVALIQLLRITAKIGARSPMLKRNIDLEKLKVTLRNVNARENIDRFYSEE